jgi:hypothetical protein
LDWNERFQTILAQLKANPSPENIEQLMVLSRDFNQMSKMYGQVIISEKYLPVHRKSIKVCAPSIPLLHFLTCFFLFSFFQPASIGGIAGGEKYIVNGILFKVEFISSPSLLFFPLLMFANSLRKTRSSTVESGCTVEPKNPIRRPERPLVMNWCPNSFILQFFSLTFSLISLNNIF